MRTMPLLCLFLPTLAACEGRQPDTELRPADEIALDTPYDLHVTFDGLIAFVEDISKAGVWALMVDANQSSLGEDDLPPCVWDEVMAEPAVLQRYIPHLTHIRFPIGQVEKCNSEGICGPLANQKYGEPLAIDADLTFVTGHKPPPSANLRQLASAAKLYEARALSKPNLDLVNMDLITKPMPHKYLAARALITTGELTSQSIKCLGITADYSFRSPGELLCQGIKGVELGEEMIWSEKQLTQKTIIELKPSGVEYRVWSTTGLARVEILNVTGEAIAKPDLDECTKRHYLESFRWFYRLSRTPHGGNCTDSYFPCDYQVAFTGRKCPEKLFVP